jgi:uncharacterized membrane protein (UPF0127 family)
MWAMRTLTLVLALLGALAVAGCGGDEQTATAAQTEFGTGTVAITTQDSSLEVPVEVATTDEQREKGLMDRESLPADEGMFFVFPGEQSGVAFWMKNVVIPLAVAVADADGTITKIIEMEPCTTDPCALYDPGSFVTALEANKGAFDTWGVRVGDHMELLER